MKKLPLEFLWKLLFCVACFGLGLCFGLTRKDSASTAEVRTNDIRVIGNTFQDDSATTSEVRAAEQSINGFSSNGFSSNSITIYYNP